MTQSPVPFVFIVGCPRSGTTLLQRLLDNHPELAVANDTHFIPKPFGKNLPERDPPLTPELVAAVRNYHRFPRLGLDDTAVAAAATGAATYRDFVAGLYRAFADLHGKPLAGEKTPDYVRRLPFLHRVFPETKILHIIRDGRDVALSARDWAHGSKGPGRFALWQESPLAVCALWWAWQVGSGREAGATIGPGHYMEIAYERLVDGSETTLRQIVDFLGLDYSPAMMEFHRGKMRDDPKLSAKKAWRPVTSGLRDWRSAFSSNDRALFEYLAGDLLTSVGYELAGDKVPPALLDTGRRCRTWWQAEMDRRAARTETEARP